MAFTAAAGGLQAYGQYQQGRADSAVARNNATMAEYQALDAQRRGEDEAITLRRRADQTKGAQRSLMASRGLDLGVGTPADILDQTDFFGQQDINTARFNAARESWASRSQAAQYRAQGRAAKQQGTMQAFGTLLGTGGTVAGKWPRG